MDAHEFALINALMERNEDMRVIAVGDDDQNIFAFRGASSKYLELLIKEKNAAMYELVENYRSKRNIVDFANQFAPKIPNRLKDTPIIAVREDNGKIKLVKYRSPNLITPLVNDILNEGLSGTTCVLTKTNEEALQITGLLLQHGMQAKLIRSNEGFSLYNLLEVRFFLSRLKLAQDMYIISDDIWSNAKRDWVERFSKSPNLEFCINMIKDFEATNPKNKYKSDLEVFIRESRLEDFYGEKLETILVSTMHKAKGREFDNVFLMLDQFNAGTGEAFRQLYVALTRAKRSLIIHYTGNYLDFLKTENMKRVYDKENYLPPCQLAMQLTFKDVWLDYFLSCQYLISRLNSGDELTIEGDCLRNAKGQPVLKFSKQFKNQIESIRQKSYMPKTAKVRFVIYWQKENFNREMRIILPELCFERASDTAESSAILSEDQAVF